MFGDCLSPRNNVKHLSDIRESGGLLSGGGSSRAASRKRPDGRASPFSWASGGSDSGGSILSDASTTITRYANGGAWGADRSQGEKKTYHKMMTEVNARLGIDNVPTTTDGNERKRIAQLRIRLESATIRVENVDLMKKMKENERKQYLSRSVLEKKTSEEAMLDRELASDRFTNELEAGINELSIALKDFKTLSLSIASSLHDHDNLLMKKAEEVLKASKK
jgi:hypothetical protein